MVSKISDVMTRNVITLTRGSTVEDAVKIMTKHKISCLVIVNDKDKPVGIVTERDMVRRVLNNGLDPAKTKIDDVFLYQGSQERPNRST